ncbi:hypothetical protein VTO73DRAFT_11837 [Trametes versicolor]
MEERILHLEAIIRAQQASLGNDAAQMPTTGAVQAAAVAEPFSPEIDPNGWYVDKPRSHASFPKPAMMSAGKVLLFKTFGGRTTRRVIISIQTVMSKHPTRGVGPRRLKEQIAEDTGVHLTRDYISQEMHMLDPDGFALRQPTSKKKHRVALVVIGPDHEWSCDGHDKLSAIGFPIWGIRDVWSGKWLGLWVVPNNRLKVVVAYLYLSLLKTVGGMPVQTTTDRGSETSTVYGFANALREEFAPNLPLAELPAHRFMRSIQNTTIERGWLRLRLEWGDDVKVFWEAGKDIYDEMNESHFNLVQWLWPKLIQQELDKLRDTLNNHKPRKDRTKIMPTGVAPGILYTLYERYGGERGLQEIDRELVSNLMESLGGEDLIRFVSQSTFCFAKLSGY